MKYKISRWSKFKYLVDFCWRKWFNLFPNQSIWNKLYEDWGKKETKTKVFEQSYLDLLNILGEIRSEIHKQTLRGGPHVILLRNKAARLFKKYEEIFEEHWLENRSYLQKLFGVKFNNYLRHNWNVILVNSVIYSKEQPESIFDIEAIYFGDNLSYKMVPEKVGEIPDIVLQLMSEPNQNIIIKRNL